MRILVLFGGESVEHEISIISAYQVITALKVNYTVIPLYISKSNEFYMMKDNFELNDFNDLKSKRNFKKVSIDRSNKKYYLLDKWYKKKYFDFAFPLVHGKGMEDGTLLAYLKFKKIPVINDSLSFYALAQNKVLTKRVLDALNIRNTNFVEYKTDNDLNKIKNLHYPLIIKPNTLGSSIGIIKVNNKEELYKGINEAIKYDTKLVVEEYLENSKEYNISVTRKDNNIITSNIEEILKEDILDYKQKYENDNKGMAGIKKKILPALIDKKLKKEIEDIAKAVYEKFEAKGVIRIDFLYTDKLYLNEINSIPGSYAYYLWKGKLDFVELLDCVIDSSKRDTFRNNKLLKTIDKMDLFKKINKDNIKSK